MNARILIIDDDKELCDLLQRYLATQGFDLACSHDGVAGLDRIGSTQYDALVLDIMLPGMQGLDVLRRLRETNDIPVLMLTARGDDTDRIVGLELGADDYLPKPCNPRELAARLRAILRRTREEDTQTKPAQQLQAGATTVNKGTRRAAHDNHELALTSAEFDILSLLLEHAGQVVDKETLSKRALGRSLTAYDRSVDVHISKIRRKLADVGADNRIISVRGQGYQFTVDG